VAEALVWPQPGVPVRWSRAPFLRRAGVGLIIRSARPHWEFSMTRRSPKWIGTS